MLIYLFFFFYKTQYRWYPWCKTLSQKGECWNF